MNFDHNKLTLTVLKNIKFNVNDHNNSSSIEGVYYKELKTFVDGRGDLTELWSKPWSGDGLIEPVIEHVYFNTTHEGVIKGWHVHEHTVSQYTCVQGKMQVVLVDVRAVSKTYGFVDKFIIGTRNPALIRIPPGVLKGWKSLKGDSVIVNLLSTSDVKDNYKYPWDIILQNLWAPNNG
jgi:dTDP-4-dehydrorhamnose 3,5-epimerase-like enzyme